MKGFHKKEGETRNCQQKKRIISGWDRVLLGKGKWHGFYFTDLKSGD